MRTPLGTTASQHPALDVSVVIVSWNTRDALRECVRSVHRATADCAFEVLVVDNASSDGTREMVRADFPSVRLLENGTNAGFAVAANRGIRAARGASVLLLNSDTRLSMDAVTALWRLLRAHPAAGAAGCALYHEDGVQQPSCGRFPSAWHRALAPLDVAAVLRMARDPRQHFLHPFLARAAHAQARDVDWLLGACLMVRREAFEHVGLLDERLFLFAEDWDWCYRLKAGGWRVLYTPDARIVHAGAGSWSESERSRRRAVLGSLRYFHRKHYGAPRAAWFKLSVALAAVPKALLWTALSALPSWRERASARRRLAIDAMAWGFGRRA